MNVEMLVSIIIPVYNAEKYLEACIDSILSQTHAEIELIIINDGSTDNSQNIIDKKAEMDSRITSEAQENAGAPKARNRGMKYARGKYIMFFDADDVLRKGAIEVLLKVIRETNADIAMGNFDLLTEKNECIKGNEFQENHLYEKEELPECVLFSPLPGNKLYNKAFIENNLICFANVRLGQDLNFYEKAISVADRVVVNQQSVMLYRSVPNSVSRSFTKKVIDIIKSLSDVEEFYLKNDVQQKFIQSLSSVRIKYYTSEISKVPKVSDKADRKEIMKHFYKELDKVNISKKERTGMIKKKYYIFHIKMLFWPIYCSNSYKIIYTALRRLIKGKE